MTKKGLYKKLLCMVLILLVGFMGIGCGNTNVQTTTKATTPAATTPAATKPAANFPSRLTITSGVMGGGWYPIAVRLGELLQKEIPNLTVNVIEGGSLQNMRIVDQGVDAQMGMVYEDVYYKAREGFFDEKKVGDNVKTGFGFMYAYNFFVTPKKNDKVNYMKDIWDKRILGGVKGTGADLWLRALAYTYGKDVNKIKDYGGTLSALSYSDAALQMQDGHGDIAIFQGGNLTQNPQIVELQLTTPMKILEFEPGMEEKFLKDNPYYVPVDIPANSYVGQDKSVRTYGNPSMFIFNKNLSSDFVKEIMRVLVKYSDQLQKEFPGALPLLVKDKYLSGQKTEDLHPGALELAKELNIPFSASK